MHGPLAPPFRPHRLLPGGDLQTIASVWLPGARYEYCAQRRQVMLADGDRIVLHDDVPSAWQRGGAVALLVHGLAGCHLSSYMQRIAARLVERQVRVFRMDLRGCGAGVGLALLPYHAGRSDDIEAAARAVASLCPGSPVFLAGFSLGGNMALKLASELGEEGRELLAAVLAVNPPVDLARCGQELSRWRNRPYDRFFARALWRQVCERNRRLPRAPMPALERRPRSVREFDQWITAPLGGFSSADEYYAVSSAGPRLSAVRVPTMIISSSNDPLAPASVYESFELSPAIGLKIVQGGGHMGYVGRRGVDPDRRWLEWRVLDWVASQGESFFARPGGSS